MIGLTASLSSVFKTRPNSLVLFLIPMFFMYLADAAMSFVFPIAVKNSLHSNTLMGIILAVSSVTGLLFDAILPLTLGSTKWIVKLLVALFIAGLFPFFTYLGYEFQIIFFLFLGSAIWGIYYELLSFSTHEFIITYTLKNTFTYFWGVINSVLTITSLIGPIIGGYFFAFSMRDFTYAVLCSILLSFGLSLIAAKSFRVNKIREYNHLNYLQTIKMELKTWSVLTHRASSVFLVGLLIGIIDAMYWTIGGLISIDLFNGNTDYNYIIMITFSLALIVGQFLVAKSNIVSNKKKIANIFIILGSLFLIAATVPIGIVGFIIIIFLSNLCFAVTRCMNDAVSSDIAIRIHKKQEYLIALVRLQASLSYIIGPILVGILSDKFGYMYTFRILGVFALIAGLLLVLVTPKKIRIKQAEFNI